MNAVEFLVNEHNKVRKLFSQISEETDVTTKARMFEDLCHNLVVHEKMEQTVWYPFLLAAPGFEEIISNLVKEEKSAAKAINKFKTLRPGSKWEELFLSLKEDVENHANEEETRLFPKASAQFDDVELDNIGSEMEEFKIKNLSQIQNKNITGFKTAAKRKSASKSKKAKKSKSTKSKKPSKQKKSKTKAKSKATVKKRKKPAKKSRLKKKSNKRKAKKSRR